MALGALRASRDAEGAMIESANREIQRAAGAAEARRREGERISGLVAALDDLLYELEELTLRGVAVAPDAIGRRAAELVAEALRMEDVPAVPATVAGLMERLYEAEDAALTRRRRAGWGLGE
jgi:hypothetical protein